MASRGEKLVQEIENAVTGWRHAQWAAAAGNLTPWREPFERYWRSKENLRAFRATRKMMIARGDAPERLDAINRAIGKIEAEVAEHKTELAKVQHEACRKPVCRWSTTPRSHLCSYYAERKTVQELRLNRYKVELERLKREELPLRFSSPDTTLREVRDAISRLESVIPQAELKLKRAEAKLEHVRNIPVLR